MDIAPTLGAGEDHTDRQRCMDAQNNFTREWTRLLQFLEEPADMSDQVEGQVLLIIDPIFFEMNSLVDDVIRLMKQEAYLDTLKLLDQSAASVREGLQKIQALLLDRE